MEQDNYRLAGWAAIISALLFAPIIGLLFYSDFQEHPSLETGGPLLFGLLPLAICLDALSKAVMFYAVIRFRHLLDNQYGFHEVDNLIIILFFWGVALGLFSYLTRLMPEFKIPILETGATFAVSYGVLGIVYAVRLLKLNGTLSGLLKPLAYTVMAASICSCMVIFAPMGLALNFAHSIILGLVFWRVGEVELKELEVI
jgi:hypothetical protein